MKQFSLAVLLLIFAIQVRAGFQVSVCDSVDKKGICVGKNDIFRFTGDKMRLYVSVYNPQMLNTTKVIYRLYEMQNDHDGDIAAELSSYAKPEWFVVVKSLYFFKPGYYRLDVLKADKSKINSTFITITDR
jgi:hypothetical protein